MTARVTWLPDGKDEPREDGVPQEAPIRSLLGRRVGREIALERATDLVSVLAERADDLLDLLGQHALRVSGRRAADDSLEPAEDTLWAPDDEERGSPDRRGRLHRVAADAGRDVDGGSSGSPELDDLFEELVAGSQDLLPGSIRSWIRFSHSRVSCVVSMVVVGVKRAWRASQSYVRSGMAEMIGQRASVTATPIAIPT